MALVEIEGTTMPAAGVLRTGERRVVEYTDRIRRLVSGGFITVVRSLQDPAPAEQPAEAEQVDDAAHEDVDEAEAEAEVEDFDTTPPARNASRDDWAEFLALYPGGGFVTENKDRATLIGEWDAFVAEQAYGGA